MTPKEYLTLLLGYAGDNAITANVINVANNKIIADRLYSNTFGASRVPKKDGTPYNYGDVVKIITPLIPHLVNTREQLTKELIKGSTIALKPTKNWVQTFQIDEDVSLDFDTLDFATDIVAFGGTTQYTLLFQSVYLLKWADYFNQRFIQELVSPVRGIPASHYTVLTGTETAEQLLDKILDTIAKIKNVYTGKGLSLPDEEIIIWSNTKGKQILTKFLKITTGNNNSAPANGTGVQLEYVMTYPIKTDDRLNKFFVDTSVATNAYDPTKPLFIIDMKGAVAQETNVVTAFRLRETDVEGLYRTGGRSVLGTQRIAPVDYLFAMSTTTQANIDTGKVSANSVGQLQDGQKDAPQHEQEGVTVTAKLAGAKTAGSTITLNLEGEEI